MLPPVPAVVAPAPIVVTERPLTYAQMQAKAAAWKRRYPGLVHETALGKTAEGRPIPIFRLSDDAAPNASEPGILIVAGIHARESQPPQCLLWLADELLRGYGTNPRFTKLLRTRQIYLVPVLNVDGKVYDETAVPGRDWRKNRRTISGTDNVGIDLNRNFPVRFGGFRDLDTTWRDTTTNPAGNIYEGTAPLSEPESRALANFVFDHRAELRLFVDFHSPLRKVITPVYVFGADAARYKTLTDGIVSRQTDKPYAVTKLVSDADPKPGSRPSNTGLSYTYAYYVAGVYALNLEIGGRGKVSATESVDGDADLLPKHYPPAESIRAEYDANIREPFLFLLDAAAGLPTSAPGNVRVTAAVTDVPATSGATVQWTPTLSGDAAYAVLTCDSPAVVVQSEIRRAPIASGYTIKIAENIAPGTVVALRLSVWDNNRRVTHCLVPLVVAPK
ncbi:MAG: hypothetical protein H7Y38_02155 [Armatimonadetes bacterium]|nr:hypothetical protein [Armatimonadota bacterium]